MILTALHLLLQKVAFNQTTDNSIYTIDSTILEIESLDNLIADLDSFFVYKTEADVEEFKISKKYNFFNYFPNIGYNFFDNNMYITYTFSNISKVFTNKNKATQKQKSIVLKNKLEQHKSIANLKNEYYLLKNLVYELKIERKIFKNELQLFEISKSEYQKQKILASDYLNAEIDILNKSKNINTLEQQIILQIADLQSIVNNQVNYKINSYENDIILN